MPAAVSDIEVVLESGLSEVAISEELTLCEQTANCMASESTLKLTDFAIDVPEGLSVDSCDINSDMESYLSFSADEAPYFQAELLWFSHSDDLNVALGDGWEMLDRHAGERVTDEGGLRINNLGNIEYNRKYMPFVDTLEPRSDSVALSRMVLVVGSRGTGVGFLASRLLEGDPC